MVAPLEVFQWMLDRELLSMLAILLNSLLGSEDNESHDQIQTVVLFVFGQLK